MRWGAVPLVALLAVPALAADRQGTIVVGSKNFEESRLLAEVFARLIEERTGLAVERRLNLAGSSVCFDALRTGAIDLYPEYTGTALVTLLGETPAAGADGNAHATLTRVRQELLRRWDLHWLSPLGFENAFEIAVRRPIASEHHLRTISDLAAVAPGLRGCFGFEFIDRADGLPGLAKEYGLRFASVQPMQQALQYAAAADGRVDVIDAYTTDGRLVAADLVLLEDDRDFFPPYEAGALVRGETLRRYPEVGAALGLLAEAFDSETMRALNLRLQERHEEPARVAADALAALGLSATPAPTHEGAPAGTPAPGSSPARAGAREDGTLAYLWQARGEIARRTAEHLGLSLAALLLGVATAVPLGLLLSGRPRLGEVVIRAVGVLQTVPSIALLAFMIPLLGVGTLPAVVALWLYSLFPIVRNTATGLAGADPNACAAATALGMTPGQVLRQVRLPLATPVILAGIRTAAVLAVGTATLAAFIGAGGLGQPIVTGLQLNDSRRILAGALPAAALAIAVDLALGWVERRTRPRG